MQHNIRQKEKGVALLLALGVMSLLLAMALAFVTNAVIARSSAANNSARSQARYFGKTAANRMLVDFMQTQKENPTLTDFSSLVSKGSGKTDALEGNSSLLTVTIGSDQYTPDSNKQPEWVYLYEKVNTDGTPANNTPIIGRYAYMVLPKPGVISLSEALRGQTDLTYPTSWEKRPGVDMKEFDLSKVITDTGLLKSAAERFGTPLEDHTSSPQVLNEDYSDYDGFFGEFSVPAATQTLIRTYFSMGGRTEAESYPYDPQCKDGVKEISDSATYYHRFNLARKDWDSGLNTTANSEDAVDRLLGLRNNESAPVFKTDDSVTPTGMRLQFLRMIGHEKGAYASLEDRRRQIAANLIDYSDSDNIPTSDVEPTSWKTTMTYPTYTGNERTPYLNEVAVQVSATAARSDTVLEGKTIANIDGIVRVESIAAEIFDIYEDIPVDSGTYSVTLSGSFDVNVSVGGTSVDSPQTVSIDNVTISIENITNRYGYGVNNSSGVSTVPFQVSDIENPESAINVTVKVSNFKIDKMVLTQGSTNVDFSRNLEQPGTEQEIMNQGFAKDETKSSSAAWGFSVDDPRENLYQGEGAYENWQLYTTSKVAGTPLLTDLDTQTLGNQNVNCLPANAGDKEGGAPETLSTAYIRNAPMTSPLELGAIHRGAKWETINLKAADAKFSRPDKYNPEVEIDATGSSYDEGDAGILDQIKMTSATYDAAKVNLNNRVNTPEGKNIFYALTSNVATIGTTAADPLAGTKSTTDAFASDIVALPATTFIPNRAGILREITYSDTGATTDMGKEALLAKTACLMTTKSPPSEDSRVILVAQAVTDIGGVKVSKIMEGKTTPSTKDTVLGTLDYDEENGKLVYFDDIRGEVKMLLTVKRDPVTQQLKVTQMEFVD